MESSRAGRHERRVAALAARALGLEPPEHAAHNYDLSLVALALDALLEGGRGRRLDPDRNGPEIVQMAMGTGDLPNLLGDAANKIVQQSYTATATTAQLVAAPRTFENFRTHAVANLDAFPNLLKVGESGQIRVGSVNETSEPVALATYASALRFSRRAIVNDSKDLLGQLMANAGQRVAAVTNDLFFATCILPNVGLGPVLSDSLTVYHATHANITSAGALDDTRLAEARAKLKKQAANELKLNTPPAYLLVAPDEVQNAERLIATIAPGQVGEDAERITVLNDANLGGKRFWVLAAPKIGSNYVRGHLNTSRGLPIVSGFEDFEADGVGFRITLDAVTAAVNFRFGATGAGI